MPHIGLADIFRARQRLHGTVLRTPLVRSVLSDAAGHDIFLKLETLQPVGSFKLRGAVNAVAQLAPGSKGVVCASTGNHGRAVAYAARRAGLGAIICLSELVPDVKVEGIRAVGGEVRRVGRSQDEAQVEVDRLVAAEGYVEVPPFDHPHVIAGQGTIGVEILEDMPEVGTVVVPLSGGGLMAGIAIAAKAINSMIRVVGVSMDRGAAMVESMSAGRIVEVEELPSLADSLGGGLGVENRWSFEICRELVDETILVTEDEIYDGVRSLFLEDRLVAEGGAAVAHAAFAAGKLKIDGPTAFVISGRNIDMTKFRQIIAGEPVQVGAVTVCGKLKKS